MRASVAEVMTQNYIRAARIKGLSTREIITQHVLRNAIPPIIPKVGVQLSSMLTLAIITESIFNWPGIGRWLLDALSNQDYVSNSSGRNCSGNTGFDCEHSVRSLGRNGQSTGKEGMVC